MKTILKKRININVLLFILIFVFAAIFYSIKLGFSDMWSDEIYTKAMLKGPLSEFYSKFRNDLHPPLYYLGLRLFTAVFGLTPLTMRAFSVLGVLSTLLLVWFAGRRIFGEKGVLVFSTLLISIPMLITYSHQARMYTWSAFATTGVFIYSYLFLGTTKNRDLILLFLFTLMAVYTHYYSGVAAIVANAFVLFYLIFTKNRRWLPLLLSMLLVVLLFLPWVPMFVSQIRRVQQAFWAPEVNVSNVLSCFSIPLTEQFWTSSYSRFMIILVYGLILLGVTLSFTRSFSKYRLVLWLSLSIFLGTLLFVGIISMFSQPILYSRYVMTIVTMLAVPIAVLIIQVRIKWLKGLILLLVVSTGLWIGFSSYSFSYGPYRQTIDYISTTYPEVKKILHISEVTAGPLVEYTGSTGFSHYWLDAEMSNVDAFTEVQQYKAPEEFLQPGEEFCVVRFHDLELNLNNLERVLSESVLLKTDTVHDNKMQYGIMIQLYLCRFKGNSQ
ncbi:MAG TPA: glycosyltransferase family 39 protein [Draconibacterium sp.]|nr:glycosyltransferase family 39 protein [Draconibacterium sp.]